MSPHQRAIAGFLLGAFAFATSAGSDDLDGRIVTEITITGLHHTKEYVVRRELVSRVGEPYSEADIRKDAERLDRLRIFSAIQIERVPAGAGVRVDVTVRETFPYLPTLSIQVNDENGVSAGPGVKSVNFLGEAIELGAAAQLGGATNLDFYIRDPWVVGNHVSYEAEYLRRDRDNELDGYGEIADELSGRFGTFIGESGRIGVLGAYTAIQSDVEGVTLTPDNHDELPAYGAYLGYDSRDFWTRPRFGWWNEIELRKTRVLDTDSRFVTATFDIRRYQTWREQHTVVATSLTTLQSGVVGLDIPVYADFHIGGTNTIRGWPLDSRNGKNQLINTIEYRYLLLDPRPFQVSFFTAYLGLQLVGFADLGHAWNDSSELALDRFIGGCGIGLRLLIPFVDQVRLDVAWGKPGEGMTFHFGIYPKAVMQRLRVR